MGILRDKAARYLIPERIPGFAAALYNKAARTTINHYYKEVAEEISDAIDSGRILDIGTGPGYLPIEMAKRKPDLRIDGIDLTRKMIEMARENASETGVTRQLNFEVGNANKLRFEDNSYDMVISTGTFHSWKDPVKAVNECYRVLKPEKEAWIYDPAIIISQENIKWIESLKGMDWIVYKLTALISKVQLPQRSMKEIREIISRTKFGVYEIEGNGWVIIKLKKLDSTTV